MGILNLDIQTWARGFQSSNATPSNGMFFKTGYQPDYPHSRSNNTVLYISNKSQVGILTENPKAGTALHVQGTIICKALIQDPTLGDGGDPGGGGPFELIIVDSKIYVQGLPPPRALQAGDLWYNTDDNPPTLYKAAIANADEIIEGEWELATVPVSLIDPDVNVYNTATIPTSQAVGDIWFDSGNNWLAYEAQMVGANEIVEGEWVLATDINNELQPRLLVMITSLTGIMADAEVISYFNEEAPDDGFMRYLGTHSNASFGDIWLDTSEINRYSASFLATNAINRWANSQGGFVHSNQVDQSGPGAGTLTGMAWRSAPTDAIGTVYLNTYLNKNIADRKSVTYYTNSYTLSDGNDDGGGFYGPNVAVTPTGILNYNPQYDTWYDISPDDDGNSENQVYVYLVNNSFDYANNSNTGFGSWDRYAFRSGGFDPALSNTGWWNARDASIIRANNAFAALNTAFGGIETQFGQLQGDFNTLEGQIDAGEFDVSFSDHEVKAFFSRFNKVWTTDGSTPVGGTNHPVPGGNNDVWILTDYLINEDGSANMNSIYAATSNLTHHAAHDADPPEYDAGGSTSQFHWIRSNTNGLGITYLDLYSRGALGEFSRGSNWMPRGYSLWDEPESDYFFMETGLESGDHKEPYTAQTFVSDTESLYIDASLSAPVNGNKSLRLDTGVAVGAERHLIFANTFNVGLRTNKDATFTKYGIDITPGKRWILSWYWKSNTQSLDTDTGIAGTNTALNMDLMVSNTTHLVGGSQNYATATLSAANALASNTWQRDYVIFDFQSGTTDSGFDPYEPSSGGIGASPLSEINSVIPFVSLRSNVSHGNITYWLDSIQLEQVGNNIFTPSQFKEPSDKTALLFGRRITDGKILTHHSPEFPDNALHATPWAGGPTSDWYFGPIPNVAPNGNPNPEPHGDLWFNTSNNNLLFRYFQNNIDNTAQSAYFTYDPDLTPTTSNSGWYVLNDNRFGLLFSNIITLNTQIYDALANLSSMQTKVDHDIITFFAPENVSLGFANDTVNPSANFGDLWINTSDYNANLTHGGLKTNAIFRYQNGTSAITAPGYAHARTDPSVGSAGPLAWYHAPEDLLGFIYLATAQNRNVADQKTVTYFVGGGGGPLSLRAGPVTETTPYGIINPNPVNDLWIDTANGNVLHIYKGNTSFKPELGYNSMQADAKYWNPTIYYGVFTPGSSQTGWWSVQDSSIAIIRQDLIANAVGVEYALANSVEARAIADHEIISYYEYEGATGFVAQTVASGPFPSGVGYGDIWINQAYWNTLPDGSLSTNAILRFSNSTGGSANETGGHSAGATSNLSWNFAPNNAIGRVFLDAYFARNLADRKTTVFYTPNTSGFGPNPNTTPSLLDNPNPEGDLWIDTRDGSNRLYVYKTNSSFLIGQYFGDAAYANAWAQTVSSGVFSPNANTGWWDAQDSEISLLRANVGNILTDVRTITSQVDREVFAYFQPWSDVPDAKGNNDVWVVTDYPVNLDGSPNTASIYVSNSSPASAQTHDPDNTTSPWSGGTMDGALSGVETFVFESGYAGYGDHFWIPSPNNAIGKFYLQAYSAGITGQFARGSNFVPRGYSLWDAPISDYSSNAITGFIAENVYSPSWADGLSHKPQYPLNYNNDDALGSGTSNVAISTGNSLYGFTSLRHTVSANSFGGPSSDAQRELRLTFGLDRHQGEARTPLNEPYTIKIPKGKKWIFSYYFRANSVGTGETKNDPYTAADIGFANSTHADAGFNRTRTAADRTHPGVVDEWSRHSEIVDLSTGGDTAPSPGGASTVGSRAEVDAVTFIIYSNRMPDDPVDYYYDAFQFEEVASGIVTPSQFKEPSDGTAIIFGRQITDGKIVAHYSRQFNGHGPTPHITPSGLPNPEPHGDFWINTSNNNMLFVYNQNGTNHTAQTANYSYYETGEIGTIDYSGWFLAQDRQLGYTYANVVEHAANIEHLFANVNFERSLTDHDVVGFFETHEATHFQNAVGTHTTAEFGDIWINVHGDNQWANGALNPNAIFRWQNTSATGANSHAARGILVWEHSPNNLTGQVYLSTWLSRNIADRATVIYFEGNTKSGDVYYGPNVATMPGSEVPNSNPDGDLWMDIHGANRLYIYKTNTSFIINGYPGAGDTLWAQTTHNATSEGIWDSSKPTGWWDAQGFDSSQIDQDIFDNRANAAFALANAQFAQALAANAQVIADGEIISFYNIEDVGAGFANDTTHGEASYGDIWINISSDNQLANGALHSNALFRYQNTTGGSSRPSATDPTDVKWHHAPNNAVGKVYLDAWKSQNTADAKVVTYIAPGTPLGTVPALYGPDPSSTPGGVHNPNPESDLWLDSNDNNRIYRYQVIGGNVTSIHAYQTPNNTHSGWADVRDARIGDFPFAEHRKAYVPMNEWSVANVGYGEELVMWDESDNLNHARYGVNSSDFSGDHNDFVDTTIKGIPTKALNRTNSIATDPGPSSPTQSGQYNKDIGLLRHDAIRNANQQSYSMWFKPTGSYQRHGHRIISRDASDFWAVLIGTNATHFNGETGHYNEFYPADGSYVNVAIQGAVTDSPTGEGRTGSDACFLAAPGLSPGGVLKYNTWNHIAFTLDYKGDDEYGNSVWYFANEDDGWENANVFYFTLDKDASANHGISGEWTVPSGGSGLQGRGVAINNSETSNVSYNESQGSAYAPVAHYSEFRYYDTFLSQASVKKLFDNPTGIEESSQGLLRTIRAQAIADGEIISFYADHGTPFVRGESHPTANFGDIWIDTSDHNANHTHGGLTTNAINRYQNTSFGPSPSEGTLVWEATPTNSVGKVYLDAALVRNMADQKTVTYYAANISSIYGPNVAVTPSGIINPNPEGDLWIDTNTNRLYVYKTNSQFAAAYVNPDSGMLKPAWAQTVSSGVFSPNANSGWWDVQDSQIATQRELIYTNEWAAANALADAATSQAAADQEILTFFSPRTTIPSPVPSGNGDIWILTDERVTTTGDVNPDSIYVTVGTPNTTCLANTDWPLDFPVYPQANGIRGVGATGNVAIYENDNGGGPFVVPGPGEFYITNEGGVDFVGPDGKTIYETVDGDYGIPTTAKIIYSPFGEGFYPGGPSHLDYANSIFLMYSHMNAVARFGFTDSTGAGDSIGTHHHFVPIVWHTVENSWFAIPNQFANYRGFIPDPANGDFIVARGLTDNGSGGGIGTFNSFVFGPGSTAGGGAPPQDGGYTWAAAPNNAIGRAYLESFSAGVSGAYQRGDNLMPRAYSLFDHLPVDEYDFMFSHAQKIVTSKPYPIGFSVNSSEERASINTTSIPPVGTNVLKFLPAADPTTSINPSGAREYFSFANTHGAFEGTKHYGIVIPTGKKWILSAYVMANAIFTNSDSSTNTAVAAFLNTVNTLGMSSSYQSPEPEGLGYTGASSENEAGYPALRIFDTANEWKQVSWTFDLNSSASTSGGIANPNLASPRNAVNKIVVRLSGGSGSVPLDTEYYYAGIQLEEVEGHVSTPSTFREPSDRTDIVFGRQITDGKIVTHYSPQFDGSGSPHGPIPHITPSGLPNPEPHGDFWINTSNGNMIFRYHQNDTSFTAQTANYAYFPSLTDDDYAGWYTGQDQQVIWNLANTNQQWIDIENSLAQTSFAQSRIDNDIAAYFYRDSGTPRTIDGVAVTFTSGGTAAKPPIEFGDIWIDTGPTSMFSNGTLGAEAIYRAQNVADVSTLTWVSASDNQVGRVYLETWATKNSSDRKTATYFIESFPGVFGTHGPNTWTMDGTSEGVYNANPEGDFWLNIRNDGNGPNNQLYIYKVNNQFDTTVAQEDSRATEGEWAQTIYSGVFTFDTSPTGWYDATDTRVNAAFMTSQTAYNRIFDPGGLGDEIGWAFDNVAFNRTEADQDRVILYHPYGSTETIYTFRTSTLASEGEGLPDFQRTDSEANFGDIWINTSGSNQLVDGSLSANAIHRAQNSSGGAQPLEGLGWYRANTNQLGLVYLDAYLARNVADRKTAIFFGKGYPDGQIDGDGSLIDDTVGVYNGPNVAYTDQNIFNPNPEGDLWYDITDMGGGVPRNVLYVYKTNSEFQIGNNFHDYTEKSVWAQTVHHGVFDSTADTGWWDVKDSRLSAAGIAADREIVAFFQPSTWADKNVLRGNGDIWIQTNYTDGGANTGSIFRYDTREPSGIQRWVQAPNNGIGLAYLKGYSASRTSGGNIMPRGYSVFDASTDATGTRGDYYIESSALASPLDTDVPYPIFLRSSPAKAFVNTSFGHTALGSIEHEITGTGERYFHFSISVGISAGGQFNEAVWEKPTLKIPKGKRWIYSYWAYSNSTNLPSEGGLTASVFMRNSSKPNANVGWQKGIGAAFSESNKWERFSGVLDLTTHERITAGSTLPGPGQSRADSYRNVDGPGWPYDTMFKDEVDSLILGLGAWSAPAADTGNTVWYDDIQFEMVDEHTNSPSEFREPSGASDVSFGRVISDGKVVAHFEDGKAVDTGSGIYFSNRLGPTPNTTPTGLDNPDPNGDIWIDTANNNAMYQYYANDAYGQGGAFDIADTTDSQRVFYVKPPGFTVPGGNIRDRVNVYSGWISTQDSGIANAHLSAYDAMEVAQRASLNRNKVYAQPGDPNISPSTIDDRTAGDLWFDTSRDNRQFTWGPGDGAAGSWVETRDDAMLFALAGSDPFDLNPFFSNWPNVDGNPVGWFPSADLIADGGVASSNYVRSSVAQSGDGNNSLSLEITGDTSKNHYLYNTITFPAPLFANSFITGVYVAQTVTSGVGVGGIAISLHHQAEGGGDPRVEHHQATISGPNQPTSNWAQIPFRAVADDGGGSREITAVTFTAGVFANASVHVGGSGSPLTKGPTKVRFDQIYFDINHPFLRMDREGGIVGTYIADAAIGFAHIQEASIDDAHIRRLAVNSAHITSVNAETIQAGTIGVGVTVGGDAKVEIDGVTGRIIIRD